MSKKSVLISIYVIGALLTNSYVRIHKIPQWTKQSIAFYENAGYTVSAHTINTRNQMGALLATIVWPIYAGVQIADTIVSTRVKVEAPEILQIKDINVKNYLDLSEK